MFILCGIAVALGCGFADLKLYVKTPNTYRTALLLGSYVLIANMCTLLTMNFGFGVDKIFEASAHSSAYCFKYAALAAVFSLLLLFLRAFLTCTVQPRKGTPQDCRTAWKTKLTSLILFGIGAALCITTYWGNTIWGALSADQMLINITSPTNGTSDEIVLSIFTGPVLFTVLSIVVFGLITFCINRVMAVYKGREKQLLSFKACRRLFMSLAAVSLCAGLLCGAAYIDFPNMMRSVAIPSQYIEENYVDPDTANLKFPAQKRNLIHIYLESMENTYFSKELGGNMNENLMPDLAQLTQEGYNFSHLPKGKGIGGHHMSTGATWSVASMVNMHTGLPMKIATDHYAYGLKDYFLPGATALGDILKKQGYNQSLMFGADAKFGGLDVFYKTHGDFRILDHKGVQKEGWLEEDYRVWWGYEDDKLYEYAKRELTRLSSAGKPFHFTMETADTHYPDGYLSKNAETPYESQYANVIRYSQAETVRFVRWIQEQPFYENTTVILIGDHLSMDRQFFREYVSPTYDRTCYSVILNPAESVRNIPDAYRCNRQWAAFDMFPTILSSIGVSIDGHRLGLGTDLFSGEKTLFERDGAEAVNAAFNYRSDFYNKKVKKGSPS